MCSCIEWKFTANKDSKLLRFFRLSPLLAFVIQMLTPVPVFAADFTLSVTPSSQTVLQGQTATYNVGVDPTGGWKYSVSIMPTGLPPGTTVEPSGGVSLISGTSPMMITPSELTPAGTYSITFVATGPWAGEATVTHSVTVTLTVTPLPPNFTISVTPPSQVMTAGQSANYNVNVGALNGFSDVVQLSVAGIPNGAAAGFDPPSLSGQGASVLTIATTTATTPGVYPLTVTGTSGALSHTANVTLTVNGVGADFAISVAPSYLSLALDETGIYTVNILVSNGFSEEVTLSVSGMPLQSRAEFTPSSIRGSGTSELSVMAFWYCPPGQPCAPGTYTLTITATSATITHSTTVTLNVRNCTLEIGLASSPASASIYQGGVASYSITQTAYCGFNGTVSYYVTGLPAGATGAFTPPSVTRQGKTTLTVTTTSAVAAGTYDVEVHATDPTQQAHSNLLVQAVTTKFTLAASPASQSAVQGSSTAYSVTLTPAGGFKEAVTFTATGLPTGVTAAFNPATLTTSGTTTMTLTSSGTSPVGPAHVNVIGTSGTLANVAVVTLDITHGVGGIGGTITATDGTTPIAAAVVEIIKDKSVIAHVTTDSNGSYSAIGLLSGEYAVFCSAPGRKTYIKSPVAVVASASTTVNASLPLWTEPAPTSREYVRLGGRVIAIDVGTDGPRTVDLERFFGSNSGRVPLPPLIIDDLTISGGLVATAISNLPVNSTVVYGSEAVSVDHCVGCQQPITLDFAQPAYNVSFLLMNGRTIEVTYRIEDDLGAEVTVTLPPNHQSGAAVISLPSHGIGRVAITSTIAEFDFWIDNITYSLTTAQGSTPAVPAVQMISRPAPLSAPADRKPARARP